jgi:hypothetical protein
MNGGPLARLTKGWVAAIIFATACAGLAVTVVVGGPFRLGGDVVAGAATIAALFLVVVPNLPSNHHGERQQRVALRASFGLRALSDMETGHEFEHLASRTYGFVEPTQWPVKVVRTNRQSKDYPLEVLNIAPSDVRLAAFVSEESALKLRDPGRSPGREEITAYPRKGRPGEGAVLVPVPLSAVALATPREFSRHGKWKLELLVQLPLGSVSDRS